MPLEDTVDICTSHSSFYYPNCRVRSLLLCSCTCTTTLLDSYQAFVVKSDMAPRSDDMAAAVLEDKPKNILGHLVNWLGKVCMYSLCRDNRAT